MMPATPGPAADAAAVPLAVQPHGLLLVLDAGTLVIGQVSGNAGRLLGRQPRELLGGVFLDLVDPPARAAVERMIRGADLADAGSFCIPLAMDGAAVAFDAIAHTLPNGLAVVELERDPVPRDGVSPSPGPDPDLQLVRRSLAAISTLSRPEEIAAVMATEVKRFTGFDRVVIERFADDLHGEIIGEAREEDMEPFLGLHVPAEALSTAARGRYLGQQLRMFQDAAASAVPLVPDFYPRSELPTDLTRATLRSLSPGRVRHLKQLGVAAGLVIPLVVEGRLWGLIVCHHRQPRFVPHEVRSTASLYAVVMSAQIEVKQRGLADLHAVAARESVLRLLAELKDQPDFSAGLRAVLPVFLALFEADGAAIVSDAGTHACGSAPDESVLTGLRGELHAFQAEGVCVTDHAASVLPSLAASLPSAAGVVAIHLGEDTWLLAFRDEVVQQRCWARDPDAPDTARRIEMVNGHSAPWPADTQPLVTELRSGAFEILRKRNVLLERANQDLRRFAGVVAHEVKNQLQPGMLALSMLRVRLAGQIAPELVHIADLGSQSLDGLIKFASEMLEFAQTETSLVLEDIDLTEVAEQAVEQLRLGNGLDAVTIELQPLPRIRGLRAQLHQLLVNLLRNAVIHGRDGSRPLRIQVGAEHHPERGPVVFVRDNGQGIHPEDQQRMFEYFSRGRHSRSPGSGIGLAFCTQVVHRHGHCLWVESAPGKGATFYFSVTPAPEAR